MSTLLEDKQYSFVYKLVSNSLKLTEEKDREEFLSAYNIILESRVAYEERYNGFRDDVEKNSNILTNLYLHCILSFFIRLVIIVALGYAGSLIMPNANMLILFGIPVIISLLLVSDNVFDTITQINNNSGYVKLYNRKMFKTLKVLSLIEAFLEGLNDTQVNWLMEHRYKGFNEEFLAATKSRSSSGEEE